MLAYAANRPIVASRRSSPNTMLAIIAAHVALVAVVMSAKMDVQRRIFDPPTIVDTIKVPAPPPPEDPAKPRTSEQPVRLTTAQPDVQLSPSDSQPVDSTPSLPDPGMFTGPSSGPQRIDPIPVPSPVRLGAQLLTPPSELKPPYPESKLASGEEALLKLRLTIDENGRVIAVEPVGRADRVFLEAARRHLLAHWRYRPASEDGRPMISSTVITLRFQLDG